MYLVHFLLLLMISLPSFSSAPECGLTDSLAGLLNNSWSPEREVAYEGLRSYLKSVKMHGHHEVFRLDDGIKVKIGYLDRRDNKFSILLQRAIRDGHVRAIDAGPIFGPKVLAMLLRLKDIAPGGEALIISGRLDISLFMSARKSWRAKSRGNTFGKPELWSDQELQAYEEAIESLKVKEGCLKVFGHDNLTKCDEMAFELDARNPESVNWSKSVYDED